MLLACGWPPVSYRERALLRDDFCDPASGWPSEPDTGIHSARYFKHDGRCGYEMTVASSPRHWIVFAHNEYLSPIYRRNFRIRAVVTWPASGEYREALAGVFFAERETSRERRYYEVYIAPYCGAVFLWVFARTGPPNNGWWEDIVRARQVSWTQRLNVLDIENRHTTTTIRVNGREAATFTHGDSHTGAVGLAVHTDNAAPLDARAVFDSYELYETDLVREIGDRAPGEAAQDQPKRRAAERLESGELAEDIGLLTESRAATAEATR
jgi:hypothetical protein